MTRSGGASGAWRRVLARPPSPAMIVALAALFVAMGGTTYAVTSLPRRSVGSPQLKKRAVRSANIAKGAVTASKLAKGLVATAPGGLSGPAVPVIVDHDIPSDAVPYAARAGWADKAGKADRSTLAERAATATSAGSAASAGSATSAGSAADADKLDGRDSSFFLSRSTVVDLPRFSLASGETRLVLRSGPLEYRARCKIGVSGQDTAEILISTTESHSAFDGDAITPDLLTSSSESARRYAFLEGPTGRPAFLSENDGTAVAPGGGEVRSTVWYLGLNLFGTTGRCHFGGLAIV